VGGTKVWAEMAPTWVANAKKAISRPTYCQMGTRIGMGSFRPSVSRQSGSKPNSVPSEWLCASGQQNIEHEMGAVKNRNGAFCRLLVAGNGSPVTDRANRATECRLPEDMRQNRPPRF
jgi:hypothetical protein